jgi:hypothetical protein
MVTSISEDQLQDYTTSQPKKPQFELSLPRKTNIKVNELRKSTNNTFWGVWGGGGETYSLRA